MRPVSVQNLLVSLRLAWKLSRCRPRTAVRSVIDRRQAVVRVLLRNVPNESSFGIDAEAQVGRTGRLNDELIDDATTCLYALSP